MTTLVETQQALGLLSMGNAPERRTSKRPPGGPADFENDDDFQFVRKSKRTKTDGAEATTTTTTSPRRKSPVKRSRVVVDDGRRPPAARRKADEGNSENTATRKSTRRTPEKPPAAASKTRRVADATLFDSPPAQAEPSKGSKIALPMSDTPVINRNKQMRKNGGSSGRRSSLGSRGRRASSLIESGQTAIPHREVKPGEFYKHIEADGLTEPRRMKQLLTWCGERALSAKPKLGTTNASAIHGARAIQDQLLKDFASRSEFSDWFGRDDEVPRTTVLRPNPRNVELDEKIAQLEENIKRLREEKESWLAMQQPPPVEEAPFTSDSETIELPDFDLLDGDDGRIHKALCDEAMSFQAVRSRTEERLRNVRSTLELQIDQLADHVHKLEQRVSVADSEADTVLGLSARRLREREERERRGAGTKEMPIMEVLRSLGSMLPDGGEG